MALTAEQLNETIDGIYETRTYSGRGMYGKTCPAFEVENGEELGAVAEIISSVAADGDADLLAQLVSAFKSCRTDAMGRDSTIIYFPRITYKTEAKQPA